MRGRQVVQGDSIEEYWALKDVCFEVNEGEVLGIIGKNGAGKSSLLKILSRITEPTRGEVELRGRVGALLEVGMGFHPELTGGENIHLMGAILGMKRTEIRRKFDAIVDFSGVEDFLDTQVKHYSSGMFMRLAFAVAAHLEPDILLVDEVLAVGDASFQRKCLTKMEEVGNRRLLLTERGASFGYGRLVSDMRSIPWMQDLGCPVIFDATHSVQMPGGQGDRSGGDRRLVPYLTRAAVAAGCDGLFLETHPRPDEALSDGPNMIALDDLPALVACCLRIRQALDPT